MLHPIHIPDYYIYDIYYNSYTSTLIIMVAGEIEPFDIVYIDTDDLKYKFKITIQTPQQHTYIYTLDVEYKSNIQLGINNSIINTNVNKYPMFNNEIIFSTMVKNEDNYIRQWINFHHNIGVSRFIIYDNVGVIDKLSWSSIETSSNLSELLKDYIANNIVTLIKWPYSKRLPKSGISGQVTQQNHSLYAFKNSKYIGFFDIDEYVNIQLGKMSIDNFFNKIIKENNIDIKLITGFSLYNKFFFNPNKLQCDGDKFLRITDCDNDVTKDGRFKCFIIPKNVVTFRIHGVTQGTICNRPNGVKQITLDKSNIYFNHYFYLNKKNRGLDNKNVTDDSILLHIK